MPNLTSDLKIKVLQDWENWNWDGIQCYNVVSLSSLCRRICCYLCHVHCGHDICVDVCLDRMKCQLERSNKPKPLSFDVACYGRRTCMYLRRQPADLAVLGEAHKPQMPPNLPWNPQWLNSGHHQRLVCLNLPKCLRRWGKWCLYVYIGPTTLACRRTDQEHAHSCTMHVLLAYSDYPLIDVMVFCEGGGMGQVGSSTKAQTKKKKWNVINNAAAQSWSAHTFSTSPSRTTLAVLDIDIANMHIV